MVKILIYIIFLIIGLAVGSTNKWWDILNLKDVVLSKKEFLEIFFTAIGSIGTLCAVTVALFRDEIRSWFKKSNLKPIVNQNSIKEDLEKVKDSVKALKYYGNLLIENSGNISAVGCEIYLEDIHIQYESGSKSVDFKSDKVIWNDNKEQISISSSSKKGLTVFELLPPQNTSHPDGDKIKIPAMLKLAGAKEEIEYDNNIKNVTWVYVLEAQDHKCVRVKLMLSWNNIWHNRLSEMSGVLTFKMNSNE